jgi:bifunctional DNA-binding transcriptional regulator/antitoxin component of YhaV-PrlF toxin-antitoxin module
MRTETVVEETFDLDTVRMTRGHIPLPAKFRTALGIQEEGTFTVLRLGSLLLLSPKPLVIPRASEAISRIMEEEGVTLEELLTGLEKQRRAIYEERYAGEE